MNDWSESYLLSKKQLNEIQVLLNEGKHQEAQELTFSIDAEVAKIRNYCWKETK